MKLKFALSLLALVLCAAASGWAATKTAVSPAPGPQSLSLPDFLTGIGTPAPIAATRSACCSALLVQNEQDCGHFSSRDHCGVFNWVCTDGANGTCGSTFRCAPCTLP